MSTKSPQLRYESKVYYYLGSGGTLSLTQAGVPKVHWFGTEGDYNVLVIDLLGPSVEELFAKKKRRFSLKTVLMLAAQMVLSG